MRLEELRKGNYVISRGDVTKIVGIRAYTDGPCVMCENADTWVLLETVKPVPLDKDILETNGFHMCDDKSYGIFKSTFNPFGREHEYELEDYISIDLAVRQACMVRHKYVVEHNGYKPSLNDKQFSGEIIFVHELQNIMDSCECRKTIVIPEAEITKTEEK